MTAVSDDITIRLRRDCMSLIADEAADTIDRLRVERDEARRDLCDLYVKGQPNSSNMTDKDYAAELGWDCFKNAPVVKTLNGVVVSKGKAVPPKFELGEDGEASDIPEITTEQIVARLRMIVAEPDSLCKTDFHYIEDAADEIELLRSTVTDCRIEIERLTAERDEARRMVCGLDADIMEDQVEYARHRGWDCFGPNTCKEAQHDLEADTHPG